MYIFALHDSHELGNLSEISADGGEDYGIWAEGYGLATLGDGPTQSPSRMALVLRDTYLIEGSCRHSQRFSSASRSASSFQDLSSILQRWSQQLHSIPTRNQQEIVILKTTGTRLGFLWLRRVRKPLYGHRSGGP